MNVAIVDNHVALDGAPGSAGIIVERMAGGLVADNAITGSGDFGIWVGRVAGCTIEENQLRKFTAAISPIRLTARSSGCTVVTSDPASVSDLGTGNTITSDDRR
jgi:parallel beta-helix repeat protein